MTSQINPNNINGAYPVAGQDNNSQGFRDNFTNTSNNFGYAAAEITDLQSKTILSAQLTGGPLLTVQNNMEGSPLSNALLSNMALLTTTHGVLSGNIPVNYTAGQVHTVTTGGDISLVFTNWPDAPNTYGWVTVQVTVTDPDYAVQLPLAVDAVGVQGAVFTTGVGYTLNFAAAGVYTFTFSTVDNGATITLSENNKQLQPFNNTSTVAPSTASSPIDLGVTTTLFGTGGTLTPTLANGVNGQVIVLIQTGSTPVAVTVANAGWTGGGIIGLNNPGETATMMFTGSKWYPIGSNGATFA